jgi:hypothetical protein
VLHEQGQDSLAALEYTAARVELPDSAARPFDEVRPLLREDQQKAYDGLDTLGQREVRVAFWTSLEPLFLTTWNERRMEHMARVIAAGLLFSSALETDRCETFAGLMWIVVGRCGWEPGSRRGRCSGTTGRADISFVRGWIRASPTDVVE